MAQERAKIEIVDPEASGKGARIKAGNIQIDLHEAQVGVDGRRRHELSWPQLAKSLGEGLSVNGESRKWSTLTMPLAQKLGAMRGEPLTEIERIKLSQGNVVPGLAEAFIQHFQLGDNFAPLKSALRSAEAASLANAKRDAETREISEEADQGGHLEAILEMRAHAAAQETVADYRIDPHPKNDTLTFVSSGGATHQAAHEVAREAGFASRQPSNPYADIRSIARGVRGSDWRERAVMTSTEAGLPDF